MRRLLFIALATILPAAFALDAAAVTTTGSGTNVPYLIAYHPLNTTQHPYLGQLYLTFSHGIVSGTYTDLSVRPGGPLANAHRIPVTGGVSGKQITLHVRDVVFRGTLDGEKIRGSALVRGSIFTFAALQGTPGSGQ